MAQKPEASGVNAVLYKIGQMKDDTDKVNAYFLDENHAIYQDEKALKIYSGARELAKKLDYSSGMVEADLHLAQWYNDRADYISALKYVSRASNEAKRGSKQDILKALFLTRWIYRGLQNFEKAIEYDNQALKIIRQMGDETIVCNAYIFLSNDYGDLHHYKMSLAYAVKALFIAEKLDNSELKAVI